MLLVNRQNHNKMINRNELYFVRFTCVFVALFGLLP
jgi:hypothetical protein